jgi:hypothetical protein
VLFQSYVVPVDLVGCITIRRRVLEDENARWNTTLSFACYGTAIRESCQRMSNVDRVVECSEICKISPTSCRFFGALPEPLTVVSMVVRVPDEETARYVKSL